MSVFFFNFNILLFLVLLLFVCRLLFSVSLRSVHDVAIKVLKEAQSAKEIEDFKKEFQILAAVKSPYMVVWFIWSLFVFFLLSLFSGDSNNKNCRAFFIVFFRCIFTARNYRQNFGDLIVVFILFCWKEQLLIIIMIFIYISMVMEL